MNITSFKFAIITFIFIFLKRLLFPEWEFTTVDFNSIELLIMVISLGLSFYYWIIVSTNKKMVKKITAIFSLLICTIFIYQKLPTNNETIERIEISDNEEILIKQLNPSLCVGDLEYCKDSIKVTKYKIFQKTEIL